MRIRQFVPLVVAVTVGGLAVPQAQAVTFSISIVSRTVGFDPAVATRAEGTKFAWTNNDPTFTHTSTQDSPLSLWSTGSITPGSTKSITVHAAGIYPYHCFFHPTMQGKVRVPVRVSPASGTSATQFQIKVSDQPAVAPFVFDLQKRVGSGTWVTVKSSFTDDTVNFQGTPGTYSFRSRLRNTSTGGASAYSPTKAITIS